VLICNRCGETVTIPAGMLVATTKEEDEEHCLHMTGSNVHLKQLDPKVQEQNEELPMLLEEKVKQMQTRRSTEVPDMCERS
jgi:hypothetical protein